MASILNFFLGDCMSSGDNRLNVWSDAYNQSYPQWLEQIVNYNEKLPQELHPAVQELEDLIEGNTRIKTLACGMIDEVVLKVANNPSSVELRCVQSHKDLLRLFNYILRVPPIWNTHMYQIGLGACPYTMLLDEFQLTECGWAFFLDGEVNAIIAKIMKAWGLFLASPSSASCLDQSSEGWFGAEALSQVVKAGDLFNDDYTFEQMYICDPSKPHYGFNSWDDFFTRKFREGIRPVAGLNDDSVIAQACEALPFRVSTQVKHEDRFWAKGGAYSLKEMLACDDLSKQFIGGTVYQAYLGTTTYHRWNSPVTGTIKRTYKIPGAYFSIPLHRGYGPSTGVLLKKHEDNWYQPYLASTATRAVIAIEADNPDIGMIAVIVIGMGEVSSCDIGVTEGQRIAKGDNLGTFHYGGSTHCVVFGPWCRLDGLPDPMTATKNTPVRGMLARAGTRKQLVGMNGDKIWL